MHASMSVNVRVHLLGRMLHVSYGEAHHKFTNTEVSGFTHYMIELHTNKSD